MTTRIQKHGLQVAASLHQMIETEALPGTGVTPDQFWKGLSELVHTLGPKNRALLATAAAAPTTSPQPAAPCAAPPEPKAPPWH